MPYPRRRADNQRDFLFCVFHRDSIRRYIVFYTIKEQKYQTAISSPLFSVTARAVPLVRAVEDNRLYAQYMYSSLVGAAICRPQKNYRFFLSSCSFFCRILSGSKNAVKDMAARSMPTKILISVTVIIPSTERAWDKVIPPLAAITRVV